MRSRGELVQAHMPRGRPVQVVSGDASVAWTSACVQPRGRKKVTSFTVVSPSPYMSKKAYTGGQGRWRAASRRLHAEFYQVVNSRSPGVGARRWMDGRTHRNPGDETPSRRCGLPLVVVFHDRGGGWFFLSFSAPVSVYVPTYCLNILREIYSLTRSWIGVKNKTNVILSL